MTQTTEIDWETWEYYGVRWIEDDATVGDALAPSHVWVDGDWTDDSLPGACAVEVASRDEAGLAAVLDRRGHLGTYSGRAYLVGSMHMEYGEDPGEIVMRDAVVVAVL